MMSDGIPYAPVSCAVYDELEASAVRNEECEIVYRDSSGEEIRLRDGIETLFSRAGAEYLRLRGGTLIRLDALRALNGKPLAPLRDR
jgi:Rho-binding antiterminator